MLSCHACRRSTTVQQRLPAFHVWDRMAQHCLLICNTSRGGRERALTPRHRSSSHGSPPRGNDGSSAMQRSRTAIAIADVIAPLGCRSTRPAEHQPKPCHFGADSNRSRHVSLLVSHSQRCCRHVSRRGVLTVRHSRDCGRRLQREGGAGPQPLAVREASAMAAGCSPRCAGHSPRAPQLRTKRGDALDIRRRDVS